MKIKSLVLYTTILSIFSSFFLIKVMSKKINPVIYKYSSAEVERFTTILLNHSVNETIVDKIDEELFKVEKDQAGKIQTLDYNTKEVNKLLEDITKNVQKDLLNLEHGLIDELNVSENFKGKNFPKVKSGVICELPMTSIFSNSLLANVGPIIPIKLSFVGAVSTNLNTKIKSYGINNLYLEINIRVEVTERITMPMMTEEVKATVDIPLSIKIIEGDIPNYYYQNGINKNSNSYILPIE